MNIAGWIRQRAFLEPEVLMTKEGKVSCKNADFYARMLEASSFLCKNGINPGDRVAGLLYNSSLVLELFFACAHIKAIFVPLNYRLAGEELDYIINNCGCSIIIADTEFQKKLNHTTISPRSIWLVKQNEKGPYDLSMNWPDMVKDLPAPAEAEADLDTPLVILYTSGTTGRPKGATLSHGNILWNAVMLRIEGVGRERALLNAPLFHVGGLNAIATQIIYGKGSLIIQRTFNSRKALDIIEKDKITCMFGAPVVLEMMVEEPDFENTDFISVRCLITGAAPVPLNLIQMF